MADDFVVHDKRLFNKDGQVNTETAPEAEKMAGAPSAEPEAAPFGSSQAQSGPSTLPPANFTGLLVGLATSAFIHLGENPEQSQTAPDLPAAKHAIDLLAVLQAKTKGNLEEEEEALLTTLLYDLRLKYVQASGKK